MGWKRPARLPGGTADCRRGVGFLAREAQQQAREASQREAEQMVGDARDGFHAATIAMAAGAGN